MPTSYISPEEKFVTCPNQDVVYGGGFVALDKEPIVLQVPDFGDRFWVYRLYDARTDEFSEIGKQYGIKPGYLLRRGRVSHVQRARHLLQEAPYCVCRSKQGR
jgi:hypothetical protein